MELIERRIKKVINPHSLVFLIQRDCHLEADFSIDILLFLLRYSSFLTDTPPANNFSKRQIPPPGELFSQNSNGARYLDPKYSRWLSTDPALGEYMSGSDAGCGGAYNPVNMSLYHYAGNNPIKYVDPDGRIYENNFERIFVQQVLGDTGVFFYDNSIVFSCSLASENTGLSLPMGIIVYDETTADYPLLHISTFIHEIYHQIQYQSENGMFGKLFDEFCIDEQIAHYGNITFSETCYHPDGSSYIKNFYDGKTTSCYVYQYEEANLSKYKTLSDLPFYEAQAEFVGDFAELYFNARFGKLESPIDDKMLLKQMAQIMNDSGYEKTEAVRWILNDMK